MSGAITGKISEWDTVYCRKKKTRVLNLLEKCSEVAADGCSKPTDGTDHPCLR